MKKSSILILGTDHFSSQNNGDLFMTEKENMLSETKQVELNEVITCLKGYRPTKVALEVLKENDVELNRQYTSYVKGDYRLTINEVDQIGFRLAKECDLQGVHAVDWNKDQDGVPDFNELGGLVESDEYKAFLKLGQELTDTSNSYAQNHTVKDFFLWLNDPVNILRGQEIYMKLALVGSESNPAGAMWTAKYWYYRNLLIYKNLVSLIDSSDERIFALYGAGHLHLLLQFIKEGGLFEVEYVSDYLG
ncbi:DUF5694 domain-containing protein [Mesobacillus subterraneus]|uniref:Uncharacterized protein n=1 Tax=Mesobacillus subterraneus TaxID=285983 RepID=A0A3R9F3D4_9BACI|nr:DUF5694 domain-containing protein [Mesobacillus subterraneus]RSD28982.1 hypothetical protein EJA10_02400 [Mesobacillus subterraneus]